jgi:hypothetical protein
MGAQPNMPATAQGCKKEEKRLDGISMKLFNELL